MLGNMRKKLLEYWKESLLYAMRANIDVESANPVVLADDILSEGRLPSEQAEAIFEKEEKKNNREKGIKKESDPKWERLDKVTILLSPFKVLPQTEYSTYFTANKPLYPFWIPVFLDRLGELRPIDEYYPVVPRELMSPVGNEENDYIFCSIDTLEEIYAAEKKSILHWHEYLTYLHDVFEQLTGQPLSGFSEELYTVVNETTIVLPEKDIQAGAAIVALYEALLQEKTLPPLLNEFITIDSVLTPKAPVQAKDFLTAHIGHLGQMGQAFPLSISQRKSLYTLNQAEKSSRVFAVNGPPGTGKTTLLQSIVANEVVLSALRGQDPTIMLACSANNQAVLNIQESFMQTDQASDELRERWLPDVSGYATYLPARSKTEKELAQINFLKIDESGLFARLEEESYHEKATRYYLNMVKRHTRKSVEDVSEAYFLIQKEIRNIQLDLQEGQVLWKVVREKMAEFTQKAIAQQYWALVEETKLFWLDFETAIEEQIFMINSSARPMVRQTILSLDALKDTSRMRLLAFFQSKLRQIKEVTQAWRDWERWKKKHKIKGNPASDETAMWQIELEKLQNPQAKGYFFDEIDTTIRNKAFHLAVHYWEGRWLEAMQEQLDGNTPNKGLQGKKQVWRTRAMLTPCFVSTFFMAPKFFSYLKYAGEKEDGAKKWENPPLLDFVDWLIVDEAGQVSPEVGVAVFALAQKAIIVGDTMQIEPVWNTIPKVDIGHLLKYQIIADERDSLRQALAQKGFLCSSGSLMKMAQNATAIVDESNLSGQKGMMLLEHRRCHTQIISYCNDLAYSGMLKPMKVLSEHEQLFPPMLLLHQESHSSVVNRDRFNEVEAQEIKRWLLQNRSIIEKHFSQLSNNYRRIEDLVGIITPFKGQRRLLYSLLRQVGLDVGQMKIGTVHALQGAEREIILFSPVYGEGDAETLFFDRNNQPNMLNVAVSRAKQSFIVIGNASIFNPSRTSPSGKLRNYLKEI